MVGEKELISKIEALQKWIQDHKCPFGNGDSYKNGIQWIQNVNNALSIIEKDLRGVLAIQESRIKFIQNTGDRLDNVEEEVRELSEFQKTLDDRLDGYQAAIGKKVDTVNRRLTYLSGAIGLIAILPGFVYTIIKIIQEMKLLLGR